MRKTKTITIEDNNRDKGKTFVITEMDAEKAEYLAFCVLHEIALIEGKDETENTGLAGLFEKGMEGIFKIPPDRAKPIFDALMSCVKIKMESIERNLVASDIEEITTRMRLKMEVFRLHTDFFTGGAA